MLMVGEDKQNRKTPLGVQPKFLWFEHRMRDLISCISEFSDFYGVEDDRTLQIIDELFDLTPQYKKERRLWNDSQKWN